MRTIGIEYPAQGRIALKELGPPPPLKPTEILIETRHSGVTNGTERHALMGEHFWKGNYPSAHGYQHVGHVVEAGAEVTEFKPGDRVFYGHYVGHRGWNVVDCVPKPGPAYLGSHLTVHLPDDVAPHECALFGVAGVALRGVRRFRVGPGEKVWVAGLGPIGQFAVQCARACGAHVTASDLDAGRVALAQRLGAHTGVQAGLADTAEALAAAGPFDCIIDTAGAPGLFADMLEHRLHAYRCRIGLLGVRMETTFNWGLLHLPEASIEVSCHFSIDDLRVLIHFLQTGLLKVAPLITTHVSIDAAIPVYETLRDHPGAQLGIVFDW